MATSKIINASTIGNLISAHLDGDDKRFLAFANFIAESYEEAGDYRSARIIRSHVSNNKAEATAVLDEMEEDKEKKDFQEFKAKAGVALDEIGTTFLKGMSIGAEKAGKFFSEVADKATKYANNASASSVKPESMTSSFREEEDSDEETRE